MTKRKIKFFGGIIGVVGVLILGWVFFPIVSYQLKAAPSQTFLSPIATQNETDYTKASSWFPTARAESDFGKAPTYYTLSIPKLNIKDAKVAIGGEDLADSLIQYPGTALPGQNGNATVFGHSVLPGFYNPKNYLTIFSTLPTLGKGDLITINFDGITYKYSVFEKYEVEPTDLSVLDQNQSDSFLSLVTCVPPGLETRRLVVKARIIPVKSI